MNLKANYFPGKKKKKNHIIHKPRESIFKLCAFISHSQEKGLASQQRSGGGGECLLQHFLDLKDKLLYKYCIFSGIDIYIKSAWR